LEIYFYHCIVANGLVRIRFSAFRAYRCDETRKRYRRARMKTMS